MQTWVSMDRASFFYTTGLYLVFTNTTSTQLYIGKSISRCSDNCIHEKYWEHFIYSLIRINYLDVSTVWFLHVSSFSFINGSIKMSKIFHWKILCTFSFLFEYCECLLSKLKTQQSPSESRHCFGTENIWILGIKNSLGQYEKKVLKTKIHAANHSSKLFQNFSIGEKTS